MMTVAMVVLGFLISGLTVVFIAIYREQRELRSIDDRMARMAEEAHAKERPRWETYRAHAGGGYIIIGVHSVARWRNQMRVMHKEPPMYTIPAGDLEALGSALGEAELRANDYNTALGIDTESD